MNEFPENFKGTGPAVEPIAEITKMFKGLNAARFLMPAHYLGAEPTIKFIRLDDGSGKLEINLESAYFFDPTKIIDDTTSGYTFTPTCDNGQLIIEMT